MTGACAEVRARVVLNAAGPWVDVVNRLRNGSRQRLPPGSPPPPLLFEVDGAKDLCWRRPPRHHFLDRVLP